MKAISRPNQYLQQRGEVWDYIRRVPTILTEKIGRRIKNFIAGCRPSELANIEPENIRLDADVSHIRIRSSVNRALKSAELVRDIPLVGVSLEAMKCAPNGLPHYRDRGYLLSQTLQKAFENRDLMLTANQKIYSFRHSFESRMLEAGLDYGLRRTLMGHRNPRPEYGDGGSLKYRRDETLKLVHPIRDELLTTYPFTTKQ